MSPWPFAIRSALRPLAASCQLPAASSNAASPGRPEQTLTGDSEHNAATLIHSPLTTHYAVIAQPSGRRVLSSPASGCLRPLLRLDRSARSALSPSLDAIPPLRLVSPLFFFICSLATTSFAKNVNPVLSFPWTLLHLRSPRLSRLTAATCPAMTAASLFERQSVTTAMLQDSHTRRADD